LFEKGSSVKKNLKKRSELLPLSRPAIGEEEFRAVEACLRSGWITSGPKTLAFEEAFAASLDAPHAVALSSATAGLHLVLKALGIGPGDEVISSSMTFASVANQIVLTGAKPVFVDVDYPTLLIRPEAVEAGITSQTRAIIPVHFAGVPVDLDPLQEIAARHGIPLIEDAAHALGTRYKDKPIGATGNIAVFSFHPLKNMTTGEGGMVTLFDKGLAEKIRLYRFHGIERDAWRRYGSKQRPVYDVQDPGYKYNLTDFQSVLGIEQLKRLEGRNKRRKELAEQYLSLLRGIDGICLPEVPSYPHRHSWHLLVVKIVGMEAADFVHQLAEWNIGTGYHFPACHLLSYFRDKFGHREGDLPECERASRQVVSLPLFPDMAEEDVDYVCQVIKRLLC